MEQNLNQKNNNSTINEKEQKAKTFTAMFGSLDPYNNDIFKQLKEKNNESR